MRPARTRTLQEARAGLGRRERCLRAPHVVDHHADVRVAALRSGIERCHDDPVDRRRRRGSGAGRHICLGRRQHRPKQHAERIHICRLGSLLALDLFRRGIRRQRRGAQATPERGPVGSDELDTDKRNLVSPVIVGHHEHRVGIELAVNGAVMVKPLERLADLTGDAQRRCRIERASSVEHLTKRGPLRSLERHEHVASICRAAVVHPSHAAVRVRRRGELPGLLPHGRRELRVGGEVVAQHLDGDRSTIADVLGDVATHGDERVDAIASVDDRSGEAETALRRSLGHLSCAAHRHRAL